MEGKPEIAIVVAARDGLKTLPLCLASIREQTQNLFAEIVVVDASGDAGSLARHDPRIQVIRAEPALLTPELWEIGLRRTSAPLAAITISQCVPFPGWIDGILSAARAHPGSAAFGGPIHPPANRSPRDWAVYFARYSAFMPPVNLRTARDLAGDNAAYRTDAIASCSDRQHGFWENLIHEFLLSHGRQLTLSPDIEVRLEPRASSWSFMKQRFLHGRYYGKTRPGSAGLRRLLRILSAPALTPYLALRIGLRVVRRRKDWIPQLIAALPWLLAYVSAWSAGETIGYLTGGPEK